MSATGSQIELAGVGGTMRGVPCCILISALQLPAEHGGARSSSQDGALSPAAAAEDPSGTDGIGIDAPSCPSHGSLTLSSRQNATMSVQRREDGDGLGPRPGMTPALDVRLDAQLDVWFLLGIAA